jgi:SAM-dependent methyltransferase
MEEFGSGYFDQQYFDPSPDRPRKSNYEQYVFGRRYHYVLGYILAWELIRDRIALGLHSNVIEAGCAKGFLVKVLNTIPHVDAFGFDLSTYAITQSPVRGKVLLADACCIPFVENSADCMLAMDILEHIPIQYLGEVIDHMIRILKPGGRLFMIVDVGDHEDNELDRSHVSIHPITWWIKFMSRKGFIIEEFSPLVKILLRISEYLNEQKELMRADHSKEDKHVRLFCRLEELIKKKIVDLLNPYFDFTWTLEREGVLILQKPV